MSKTPFEIRLELLKMAKEMLEADYFSQKELILRDWENGHEAARNNNYVHMPTIPTLPVFPSESAVIAKAKLLNEFISER
jgi:hypothetical protein